jgi:hypothetical protein
MTKSYLILQEHTTQLPFPLLNSSKEKGFAGTYYVIKRVALTLLHTRRPVSLAMNLSKQYMRCVVCLLSTGSLMGGRGEVSDFYHFHPTRPDVGILGIINFSSRVLFSILFLCYWKMWSAASKDRPKFVSFLYTNPLLNDEWEWSNISV